MLHQPTDLPVVPAGKVIEQPFEIGGNQDIHRRGRGGIKRTVPVVHAGFNEIGQNPVSIGCADQPGDRQSHFPGVIGGENIAEISGRHHDVDGISQRDLSVANHVAVSGNIIHDLRNQPAPVDGVGAGEHHAVLLQLRGDGRIGENRLYAGLRVVKISPDGADGNVAAFLRGHLELLHRADPILRVKHQDAGIFRIAEAFQRRFPRVAGRGNQNDDGLSVRRFLCGHPHQMRQNLERHILESTGRSMPELKNLHPLAQRVQRRDGRRPEALLRIGEGRAFLYLLR